MAVDVDEGEKCLAFIFENMQLSSINAHGSCSSYTSKAVHQTDSLS